MSPPKASSKATAEASTLKDAPQPDIEYEAYSSVLDNIVMFLTTPRLASLPPGFELLPPITRAAITTSYSAGLGGTPNPPDVYKMDLVAQQVLSVYYNEGVTARVMNVTPLISSPTIKPDPSTRLTHTGSANTKLADPEFFRGRKSHFGVFLSSVQRKIRSDPAFFDNDEKKILYVGSFLREEAGIWFNSFTDKHTGEVKFTSFESFVKAFCAAFDDPDLYATTERQLKRLRQTGSCAEYHSRFLGLVTELNWKDDQVRISLFKDGLKDSIKDQLVGMKKPIDFDGFAQLCIELDGEIIGRQEDKRTSIPQSFQRSFSMEKKPTYRYSYNQNPEKNSSAFSPRTTNWRTNEQTNSQVPFPQPRNTFPPSTAARQYPGEKYSPNDRRNYRMTKQLCTYCGMAGHFVKDCRRKHGKHSPALGQHTGKTPNENERTAFAAETEDRNSGISKDTPAKVLYFTKNEQD